MNERVAQLVEEALTYRGYVTLSRSDGSQLVGFVYDRGPGHVELFDESATRRMRVPLAEIADIAFTGADTARAAQEIWERRKGTLESRETSAYGDWAEPAPLLVVVALERELRSVARALGVKRLAHTVRGRIGGSEVVAVAAGIGGEARQALSKERPRLLLSCGFAGGLDQTLQTGDLVVATAVRDEARNVLVPQEAILRRAAEALEGLRCRQGEILSSRQVVATAADKRGLSQQGGLAVDMESHSAALAATEAGISWLAVRVILDPLEVPLPPFTREARSSYLRPALRYALSGPRAAADLFALAGRARRAGAALDEALRRLVPALAAPEVRA